MTHKSKRSREIAKLFDVEKLYTVSEAIDILQRCPPVKFEQSVELSLKTGVDPKKSDQQVRGTVSLPKGTGKRVILVAFARGDKVAEAIEAGADFVGSDDLIEKIKGGWTEFTAVISTPDMMRDVGKLGKVLGPRGLMPTLKGGNVTNDIKKAVQEIKAGKIEFKTDKSGVINLSFGKVNFQKEGLIENLQVLFAAINRAKPSTAKGNYFQSLYLATTMGPGIKIDLSSLTEGANS